MERPIQSTKRSLLVLGSRRLTSSVFHTVVAEAKGILNSRLSTHVGSNLIDKHTPNYFLIRSRPLCFKPCQTTTPGFKLNTPSSPRPCCTIIGHVSKSLYQQLTSGQNGRTPMKSSRKTVLFGSTKILRPEKKNMNS